jgi:Tfp pilus assembly protein PilF
LCSAGCKHDQAVPNTFGGTAAEDRPGPVTPQMKADYRFSQGKVLELRGDREAALAAYQEAVKQDPSRWDAYQRLAILHDLQGKFRESEELYRKALAAKPGNADVYNSMGYSYYLQQRWAEAEVALRQALAIQPEHRKAHNNLGKVLARNYRPEEALVEFRRGGCSEADAHINLAFHLTLENCWDDARKHYERALTVEPSSGVARKGLDELNKVAARADKGPGSLPPGSLTAPPTGPGEGNRPGMAAVENRLIP